MNSCEEERAAAGCSSRKGPRTDSGMVLMSKASKEHAAPQLERVRHCRWMDEVLKALCCQKGQYGRAENDTETSHGREKAARSCCWEQAACVRDAGTAAHL